MIIKDHTELKSNTPLNATSRDWCVILKNLKLMTSNVMGSKGGSPSSGTPVSITNLNWSKVLKNVLFEVEFK